MLPDQNLPVIIVHYHLRPGGVTQVILNQIKALQAMERPYLVLTGEQYQGGSGINQEVIPNLNYLQDLSSEPREIAESLFSDCIEAVTTRFGLKEVLWHFHNPTLGKNVAYPKLIELLAQTQERLLLQCHDFAEDGRPKNYQLNLGSPKLYPMAPNIHYALVNSRDRTALQAAGVHPEKLHLLQNAISDSDHNHQPSPHLPPLVIYPVRGIRRKNIGELLLWSALAPEGTTFALTSAPKNPEWLPIYNIWQEFAQDLDLPVIMDCVGNINAPRKGSSSFKDWVGAASHCITTSISEGFGLTFLESLAQDIPLIGRDLPDITQALELQNTPNTSLYTKILVGIEELDQEELKSAFLTGYAQYNSAYGHPLSSNEIEEEWNKLIANGNIDFGNLPEHLQIFLIIKAKIDDFRGFQLLLNDGATMNASDWINQAVAPNYSPVITSNLLGNHQPQEYQQNYQEIIKKLSKSVTTPPAWLGPENLLEQYLRPERFNFLMT